MKRLADLATRRPLALLGPGLVIAALLVALALGAPKHLAAGSTRTAPGGPPDLVIVARGPFPASSRVYRVAVRTILAGLRSNPDVAGARTTGARGELTRVAVRLSGSDEAARESAAQRVQEAVDPGPLTLHYGGEALVLVGARHSLEGQFWKLELLALPLVALVLVGFCGAAAAIGAAIAATGAIAMMMVGMRAVGAVTSVSLLGAAPGGVVGLALAVELATLLRALHREERLISPPAEALARTLSDGARLGVPLAALAALVPLALLITPFPATGSLVLGTALAAVGAVLFTAATLPPLLALEARISPTGAQAGHETRVGEAGRRLLGRIASSRIPLMAAFIAAIAVPLVIAAPARDADTRPVGVADLPAHTQAASTAREEAELRGPEPARPAAAVPIPPAAASLQPQPSTSDVVDRLPLAAAIVAGALALALVALARSPKPLVAVPFALLPAAAALGALTFVVAQGHLASDLGLRREGSLDTGAVVCGLAAVVAVSAGRSARDWLAVRSEARLGAGVADTTELAASLVLPAAAAASLVAAAACGVLGGADLYPAREFGLLVAFGLLIDLLLRPPLLAMLARLRPGD